MSVQTLPAAGMAAATRPVLLADSDRKTVNRLTGRNIGVGISALTIGLWLGVLQGLEHAGLNWYAVLAPGIKTYYQGLTIHGVLNALAWTTFFICGFFTYVVVNSFKRPLRYPWINWLSFVLMASGLLLAAYPLFANLATVLYTFYPPMLADWTFYLGLALIVVGSWVCGYSLYFTYGAWRKENPGIATPFLALAPLITMVMWQIATLGVCRRDSLPDLALRHGEQRLPRRHLSGHRRLEHRHGPAARALALLVFRPSARLLLAAARLCQLGTACCPPRPAARCSART